MNKEELIGKCSKLIDYHQTQLNNSTMDYDRIWHNAMLKAYNTALFEINKLEKGSFTGENNG